MSDKLSDEQIDAIANDGHRNAAGGIYATSVHAFAREIEQAVLAASPAPAIPTVDAAEIIEQCALRAAIHSQYPVETDFDRGYEKARLDAARSIRTLKAAPAILKSEDALLTAARRAIPALAHAAERNPAYQRDYEELSKAIEDAARKGGGC
ncbi:hypothetical protein [Burkholderia gladioli]|uniref:hypothetical protein n=1 Tax=Burkholderia gladioli TaxID=28095 RepID=UPI00265544E3|nr:hypothetical protein [Burkholderia gladioli]MDN7724881.1 hypothetical protein [Burkholderia gladioli]